MVVTGSKKNRAMKSPEARMAKGFWDARPFTRVVSLGQDLLRVARYISLNATETVTPGHNHDRKESRQHIRAMFDRIQEYLAQGLLPRSPSLIAAGFV